MWAPGAPFESRGTGRVQRRRGRVEAFGVFGECEQLERELAGVVGPEAAVRGLVVGRARR
jgi:hypothetical protein